MIRNDASVEVRDIELTLYELDGRVLRHEVVASIAPGRSVTVRHGARDLRADLRFVVEGRQLSYREQSIDLWAGEGLRLTIDSSGAVDAKYDRDLP